MDRTTAIGGNLPVGAILIWPALAYLVVLHAVSASAASLVPAGEKAPALELPALGGGEFRLSDHQDEVVLLLFGELFNAHSRAAGADLAAVLSDPAMTGVRASGYMVVTQNAPVADLLAEARKQEITLPLLHDPERRAFADYRVVVLPSLLVINGAGTVVLPCAGHPLDFRTLVEDALMFAVGQLSPQEFRRRRNVPAPGEAPETQIRALRLAALGEQLVRGGSTELAINTFADALALHAECAPARVGLGRCYLNQGDLVMAETEFRQVLDSAPASVEAGLGLVTVQIRRGGSELEAARRRIQDLLRTQPDDPRIIYLAGVVAEASGETDAALGLYRRSAERLLYGQEQRR